MFFPNTWVELLPWIETIGYFFKQADNLGTIHKLGLYKGGEGINWVQKGADKWQMEMYCIL